MSAPYTRGAVKDWLRHNAGLHKGPACRVVGHFAISPGYGPMRVGKTTFISVRQAVEVLTDPLAQDTDKIVIRLHDDPEDTDMEKLRQIGISQWERTRRLMDVEASLQRRWIVHAQAPDLAGTVAP